MTDTREPISGEPEDGAGAPSTVPNSVNRAPASFTPGPWAAERSGPTSRLQWIMKPGALRSGSYNCIADVCAQKDQAEAEANARLISATPELLAALRAEDALIEKMQALAGDYLTDRILGHEAFANAILAMLDGPTQRDAQGKARAAISKAEQA